MTIEIYLRDTLVKSTTATFDSVGDTVTLSHACGSVTVRYASRTNYRDYHDAPSWDQVYVEIDAPASGFELGRHVLDYTGEGSGTPPSHDYTYSTGAIAYPATRQANDLTEFYNSRPVGSRGGTWTAILRVYFRPVPTNLLVNSSTAVSPVTLVYDPSTNKLVADY